MWQALGALVVEKVIKVLFNMVIDYLQQRQLEKRIKKQTLEKIKEIKKNEKDPKKRAQLLNSLLS